jgi:hypothetical protein
LQWQHAHLGRASSARHLTLQTGQCRVPLVSGGARSRLPWLQLLHQQPRLWGELAVLAETDR